MLHQLVCLQRRPNSSPGSPFGICGGQRDTGRVLSQSTFLCQLYSSSFRLLTEKRTGESWGRFNRSNASSEIEERKKQLSSLVSCLLLFCVYLQDPVRVHRKTFSSFQVPSYYYKVVQIYDRDWFVCKQAAQVPVIFEPPCTCYSMSVPI
jgi:hypothetical protein